MIKYLFLSLCFLTISNSASAQKVIDVKSYFFKLIITDSSNVIRVREVISVDFVEECNFFELDLNNLNADNKGMVVHSIQRDRMKLNFDHSNDKLKINTGINKKGTNSEFRISYSGIPEDGLVIGENKYKNRTIFGDNWPKRARNWLATVDHPSDKALVDFEVIAPAHYTCISNGKLMDVTSLDKDYTASFYSSEHELPTKVMVIGLADFTIDTVPSKNNFPITSWVYKEDQINGFDDLKVTVDPLTFFINNIGPFPFEKLANVQSTTRYGGMENAGCIFYDEHAVKGDNSMENLIAHEIAHQWFGNSVTETDWKHLWLSEGFATYMTNTYLQDKYGIAKMNEQFDSDRKRIIEFKKRISLPVIDTITTDLIQLLNPNSYQKGAWTLHMLHNKLGNDTFWKGIRLFYFTYKYSNASSNDFIKIMEEVSDENLNPFFNQWLRKSEIPIVLVNKKKVRKGTLIRLELKQGYNSFTFPLEVQINNADKIEKQVLNFNYKTTLFEIFIPAGATFSLDPDVKLLFEQIETKDNVWK
ncbi:MAG: M1 family metallopeptidase [Flavobacteriales bacterium]